MLGDALLHQKKQAEASRTFKELSGQQAGKWTAQARLRLAGIELNDGHAKECVRLCEQLWQDQQFVDVAIVFRLWGSAYDNLGEHDKAARCYSGEPPE
jgi:hypothetical protein